jgi:hypothetical protein
VIESYLQLHEAGYALHALTDAAKTGGDFFGWIVSAWNGKA